MWCKSTNSGYEIICLNCTEKCDRDRKTVCHMQLAISHGCVASVPGPSEGSSGSMLQVPTTATSQILPTRSSSRLEAKTKQSTGGWAGMLGRVAEMAPEQKEPCVRTQTSPAEAEHVESLWLLVFHPPSSPPVRDSSRSRTKPPCTPCS